MADGRDTLRIVTLSDGGRPVAVLDLNDADGYFRDREGGFAFTPAAVTQQVSRSRRQCACRSRSLCSRSCSGRR
jgi:hypothetical protein